MPYIDTVASSRIRAERRARGLSPEALAEEIAEMARREGWKTGTIDAYTIRRIEGTSKRHGRIPQLRVQCVLGLYFGMPHQEIWRDEHRVWLDEDRKLAAA